MIVVIWRKVSSNWKTIGAKRILFYSWSCTKAFASTSRKNSLNDLGGQFAFWFCSFDNGKASLALPQEKYQKLFHVNIKAFEALSFLIFFLQKSKKMALFCFHSRWENCWGLWDTFWIWSIFFFWHNLFLIYELQTKIQIFISSCGT